MFPNSAWDGKIIGHKHLDARTRQVMRKWDLFLMAVRFEDRGGASNHVRVLNIFKTDIAELIEAIEKWLQIPLIKPDSERLAELLPPTCSGGTRGALHFVNRHESMRTLLDTHQKNETKRRLQGSGAEEEVAFMDTIYGTGKTMFGRRYLALATQYLMTQETEYTPSHDRAVGSRFRLDE